MLRSRRGRHSVFAVYDISSSSVGGAHVLGRNDEDGKTVFLAQVRDNAPLYEHVNIKRFVEDTVKHLEEVVTRVHKADVHHPSFIQVILASPWYSSQTRTIFYKKETPFVCTKKFIDSLIDAEIAHIFAEQSGPFGAYGTESAIIEKQISGIKLNGYPTNVPYGKKALTLELSLTLTIVPKQILDLFSDVLRRSYGTRNIGFTTSAFTTFVVMRDVMPIESECVVIDVGEEVTDVAFVKGGTLLYQHSFPVGTYGLYRTLVEQGGGNESAALLEAHRLGKLSRDASATVDTAINAFGILWQKGFQQVLEKGQYGFCTPQNIIVTADSRFESLLTSVIQTDPFVKHSCAGKTALVTFMNPAMLESHIVSTDAAPLDAPLCTAALFVERIL